MKQSWKFEPRFNLKMTNQNFRDIWKPFFTDLFPSFRFNCYFRPLFASLPHPTVKLAAFHFWVIALLRLNKDSSSVLFIYLLIYLSFCCRHGQHPWGQNGGRCQRRPTGGVKLPFKPERINIIRKSHQTFQIVVSSLFCCFFCFFLLLLFFFLAARYANNGDRLLFLHQTPSPSSFCSLFLSLLGHFCLNNGEGNAEMQLRFIAIPADPFRNDRPDHYPVQFRFESMIHLSPSSISFDS